MNRSSQGWESSVTCDIVVFKGEGRAFCAGGDVVGELRGDSAGFHAQSASTSGRPELTVTRVIPLLLLL